MKLDHNHIIKQTKTAQKPFEVKSVFWLKNDVFVKHVGSKPISIHRNEIKNDFIDNETERAIVKTLAWGYPNAMRRFNPDNGNIALIAQLLKHKNDLNTAELYFAFGALMQIEGIGPSTITKLLFFNGNTFKNTPCLILDERVINSIKVFDEFEQLRDGLNPAKVRSYINFLNRMQEVSDSFFIAPEQLEIYLFEQNGKTN
ncbi:MAG: hypothetical protein ACJAX3_001615 [Patiriisocius sp.]|jgi:hypothetical protein